MIFKDRSNKKVVDFSIDRKFIIGLLDNMFQLVIRLYSEAFLSLLEQDAETAQAVLKSDDEVDNMEIEIEEECLRIIALRQPVKDELRFVFSVLKVITDLERIGDQVTNISKITVDIIAKKRDYITYQVPKELILMYEITLDMLKKSSFVFSEKDYALAVEVFKKDKEVDDLYKAVFNMVLERLSSSSEGVQEYISFLFVARYIERIGDHIANIAERAYYMVTGKRIKFDYNVEV